jgi:hypothetical protein
MELCRNCGEYYFGNGCHCKRFEVAILEWDVSRRWEKGKSIPGSEYLETTYVNAKSVEEAAEKAYRERDDEPDCCEKHVAVRQSGNGDDWKVYVVHAEAVIDYHCARGLDRFSSEATRICDQLDIEIDDKQRPHTVVGERYYSLERIAIRAKQDREREEREAKREEREANRARKANG